jgi:hypothetical protein
MCLFYCHSKNLLSHWKAYVQWLELMLKGLERWVISPLHHLINQTGTNLWTLPHPMKYCKPIV